jgi:serine/threonine protein kinase
MPDNEVYDVVDHAIGYLADGEPIDWAALDLEARSDAERDALKYLRIVGDISTLHSSIDDPLEGSSKVVNRPAEEASTVSADLSEMWGRYRLIEKVGEGSFGTVHRAWDPELERTVAIKILHRNVADAQLKEGLLREGRALAKVRHPNVVSVFGVESHGDRVGLCMEFVTGETLEAALRTHGALNAREAVLVGQDVCGALAAVHRAGFVHRDVKTRNVMREREGRIVLMDFGTGRETRPGATLSALDIAGTPVYMAPEVLAGHSASARSDVYSVGVLLYRLVTLEYPVVGQTMEDLHEAHAQGRRQLLSERRPDLPFPFIQVVERALAADPAHRYPSAGALLEALGTLGLEVKPKDRTIGNFLITVCLVLAGTVCGLTILGYLISAAFNLTLDRSEFANETVRDWFVWGVRSSVLPTALLLLALLTVALATVIRRIVISLSAQGRRLDAAIRRRLDDVVRQLGLDDTTTLASWALLVSAAMLISGWWYFSPLLGAVLTHISTARAEDLAFLSPGHSAYQDRCRQVFTAISIFSVVVWYLMARLVARQAQPLNQALLAGGIVIAVLSVLTLDMPYRLFIHAQADTARWEASDCYILGERADDALLFCPTIPLPRNRVVPKSAFQRVGTRENIFTKFSPGAAQ